MDYDGIDLDTVDLPKDDGELAFAIYERRLREKTSQAQGDYEYLHLIREYAINSLAFIEVEGLAAPDFGEPPYDDAEFQAWYNVFKLMVARYTAKISLARSRGIGPDVVSAVRLNDDYRAEIHGLLDRVRKVVASMNLADDKKDQIYTKIAKLQTAIDTTMTSVAAFSYYLREISAAVGDAAKNVEPFAKLLDHIRDIFGSAMDDQKQGKLSSPPKMPKLPKPENDDDEIPF